MEALADAPHRRLNLLSGRWLLCSPHRAKRPWQGQMEAVAEALRPQFDAACYLCPGNARAGGSQSNPPYTSTYVFTNDFPALLERRETATDVRRARLDLPPGQELVLDDMLRARTTYGTSRVVCFSPRHDLTVAEMPVEALRVVVDALRDQSIELSSKYAVVQIFENRGDMVGCSNPHPHGQIWATDGVPDDIGDELRSFRSWRDQRGSCLLCDYVALEERQQQRIVARNESWLAVVPFWAYWPFETLLMPRQHAGHLRDLTEEQRDGLADILRTVTCKYDNLFQTSFPYTLGVHQTPCLDRPDGPTPDYHLHIHIDPPLLRSATVKKFMTGYELFAEVCRDITAEQAAARLAALSSVHYKDSSRT